MSAKHTAGPWEVEPAGADGNTDYGMRQLNGKRALLYLHIKAAGGGRIGQCYSNCLVKTDEELHANARLFAAAPKMLQALEVARLGFACTVEYMRSIEHDDLDSMVVGLQYIDAAIAAATGGSS